MSGTAVAVGVLMAFSFLGGAALWHHFTRALRSQRLAKRFQISRDGEVTAEAVLEASGYAIAGRQVRATGTLEVDGKPADFEVIADLLVERDGRVAVVEVKTRERASNPTHAATRRQLREYAAVFEADDLLLVNPEEGTISTIHFPGPAAEVALSGRLLPAACFFGGLVVAAIIGLLVR